MTNRTAPSIEPPPLPTLRLLPPSELEVVRVFLIMQGALGAMATLEALVAMIGFGSQLAFPLALSACLTGISFWAARRLTRRDRRIRRTIMTLQGLWLFGALLDLALSLFLAGRGLGIVATLTRVAIPIAVVWLLRRPAVRTAFVGDQQ